MDSELREGLEEKKREKEKRERRQTVDDGWIRWGHWSR